MSLSRDSRQERKLKAVRRAQFALQQRLERIDFEEDVLMPEVEALKAGHSVLGLESGEAFDIVIQCDENPDQSTQSAGAGGDSDAPNRRMRLKSVAARLGFRH